MLRISSRPPGQRMGDPAAVADSTTSSRVSSRHGANARRCRVNDHEDLRPVGPEPAQEHPKATVQIREPWPFHRALQHGELLPKSVIFERQ